MGLKLGLHYTTLEVIEKNNIGDLSNCIMEMLAAWLKKQDSVEKKGGPTWEQLVQALSDKEEKALAESIRVKHVLK